MTLSFPKKTAVFQTDEDYDDDYTQVYHPPDLTVVGIFCEHTKVFYCVECGKDACKRDSSLIPNVMFHHHVHPFSQRCHQCLTWVVEGESKIEKFIHEEEVPLSKRAWETLVDAVDKFGTTEVSSLTDTYIGVGPSRNELPTLPSLFDVDESPTIPDLACSEITGRYSICEA